MVVAKFHLVNIQVGNLKQLKVTSTNNLRDVCLSSVEQHSGDANC